MEVVMENHRSEWVIFHSNICLPEGNQVKWRLKVNRTMPMLDGMPSKSD
jgi:hypothetical protein